MDPIGIGIVSNEKKLLAGVLQGPRVDPKFWDVTEGPTSSPWERGST